MMISFGVGVFTKHGVALDKEDQLSLHSIRKQLKGRSPSRDLASFIELSARHIDQGEDHASLSHWKKALRTFTTTDHSAEASLCPDSQLTLEFVTPSHLAIGSLDQFLDQTTDSRRQSACVMSLLSHFVTTYSDTIADIRLSFPKFELNNNNKGVVQAKTYSQSYPYHDAGLDGTGQIIGIGDSGIDELSCFFRNDDNSLVARSSYSSPTFDLSKRKVIQYINYADSTDVVGGHGTHVAGTVAGSWSNLLYGGHAPGAKIAFFDMGSASSGSGISYPSPAGSYVFPPAYNAGARIHSNSWGGTWNGIDTDDLSIDSFQYSHADFLAIFAAGNDGADGFYSVGSPATTKNSLTVGASRSESNSEISSVAYFSSLGPTFDERIKVRLLLSSR
jgi:hypothetical protein